MALHLVVHHPADPHQPWANAWEPGSEDRLRAITTTAAIGRRLAQQGRAFVHRCGHGGEPPAIVCESRVETAVEIDRRSWYVTFSTLRTLRAEPRVSPGPGTNSYEADPPG